MSKHKPASLYHYTSTAGLRGIVESSQLRLSEFRSLNDPQEIRHIDASFIDVIRNQITTECEYANSQIGDILREFELGEYSVTNTLSQSIGLFVLSLTELEDDLVMWMSYARGNGGICIEFDAAQIQAAANGTCIQKVSYKTNDSDVDRKITVLLKGLKPNDQFIPWIHCLLGIVRIGLTHKDSHWKHEKEHRITVEKLLSDDSIKYKECNTFTPYTTIDIDINKAIKGIIVSKTLPEINFLSLQAWAKKMINSSIHVRRSSAQVRW